MRFWYEVVRSGLNRAQVLKEGGKSTKLLNHTTKHAFDLLELELVFSRHAALCVLGGRWWAEVSMHGHDVGKELASVAGEFAEAVVRVAQDVRSGQSIARSRRPRFRST